MTPLHVALAFNDRYWALAYTVMRSICLSTTRRQDVVFHLCHTEISAGHAATIETIASEFGATLAHYQPYDDPAFAALIAALPATKRFPPVVYARLLLDQFLPAEVEKIVYLDCDILVRHPIENLLELDLHGKALGAVADPYHDGLKRGRDIRDKHSPFDTAEPYFNSGVLLIDRSKLAAADIPQKLRDMEAAGILSQMFFDQDILNYIFRDDWYALDWRFNVMMPKPAHETMGPHILHYTMFKHPWTLGSGTAFARTYRHVMTNAVFYRFWRERLVQRISKAFGR